MYQLVLLLPVSRRIRSLNGLSLPTGDHFHLHSLQHNIWRALQRNQMASFQLLPPTYQFIMQSPQKFSVATVTSKDSFPDHIANSCSLCASAVSQECTSQLQIRYLPRNIQNPSHSSTSVTWKVSCLCLQLIRWYTLYALWITDFFACSFIQWSHMVR